MLNSKRINIFKFIGVILYAITAVFLMESYLVDLDSNKILAKSVSAQSLLGS
jgi:hypothetical protein